MVSYEVTWFVCVLLSLCSTHLLLTAKTDVLDVLNVRGMGVMDHQLSFVIVLIPPRRNRDGASVPILHNFLHGEEALQDALGRFQQLNIYTVVFFLQRQTIVPQRCDNLIRE